MILELYISGSTDSRKLTILQVETPLGMILAKTKFSVSKQFVNP